MYKLYKVLPFFILIRNFKSPFVINSIKEVEYLVVLNLYWKSISIWQVTVLHKETLKEKDANLIKISKLEALNDELQKNNTAQSKKILEQQTVRNKFIFCSLYL